MKIKALEIGEEITLPCEATVRLVSGSIDGGELYFQDPEYVIAYCYDSDSETDVSTKKVTFLFQWDAIPGLIQVLQRLQKTAKKWEVRDA